MLCPVCKEPLIILELNQIDIDLCTNCGGIWLDSNELELILGEVKSNKPGSPTYIKSSKIKEKKIKCPLCLKKMNKIHRYPYESINLDMCPLGEGIWLNKGELEELLRLSGTRKNHKVISVLKELFQNI